MFLLAPSGYFAAADVPTLAEAVALAPEIIRVEILEVKPEGLAWVAVREVYFGEFENAGWVDGRYEVTTAEGASSPVAFEWRVGAQYVIFATRAGGGVYRPFFVGNTRWGVADVVGGADGELDLSRLAEGARRIRLADFRELVRQVKWGM